MSREIILKTTLNLFAHFGIKGITMSQIAESLRISKKTLYVYFNSKEELLCACLDYEKENILSMMQRAEKGANNTIESISLLALHISQYKSSFCPAFYQNIQQYYQANCKLESINDSIRERFICLFREGIEKGLFHSNNNYGVIASVFMDQIILMNNMSHTSHPSHQVIVLLTFLRGLSTEKGLLMIEELVPKEDEKFIYDYDYK